jgi:eukaryotic-like serine/threonine-protein kinase
MELGELGSLLPAYLRGQAFILLHDGNRAAREFQKFIDHRGLVGNFAMARLQLARAYALSGEKGQAQTAYRAFLTFWKDADPDVPILIEAKAEYAKLLSCRQRCNHEPRNSDR